MADELEVRVTVTRKASTEHSGADHEIATVTSTMNSADRVRFLTYLAATLGTDDDGNARTQEQIIAAFWAGISAGTVANIVRYEQEAAAQSARDAVTPISVTQA